MKKIISIILALVMAISVMSLTALAEGLKGDVNGDNAVTAVDARIILQHVAELRNDFKDTCDVNGDGNISAVDARIVLRIVAGLEEPEDKPFETEEEQLEYFKTSFNGVKTNAVTATNGNTKLYNYNDYVYVHPVIKGMYEMTAEEGALPIEEQLTAELSDELVPVNKTYEGSEAIASAFPPIGGTCNLTMKDVSKISIKESGEYYLVEITVKGKRNPERYESIGNVATIVTKADMESGMSPEDLEMMRIDCDYKEAVVKAKIEKSTGNMVEYSVDYPMIMIINIDTFGEAVKLGMGFYEDWTITY
jgi:hypothetical protein